MFKTFNSETSRLSYKVKGVLKNNRCELSYDCDADALLMVEGKTEIWMSTSGGSGSTENDIAFVLFAGGDNTPLYDFELENGTATEEYNGFKDEFMTSAAYGWFLLEYYPEDPTKSKRTLTTTQTITVELPEED